MNDTQIYSENDYKFYAIHAHSLKECHVYLDGIKNRISDDNSLKNKIELTTKKLENDD